MNFEHSFDKVVNENTQMSSSFLIASCSNVNKRTPSSITKPATSAESPHRNILGDLCGEKNEVVDKDNMKFPIAFK
jgi:hypothetical protein